MSNQQDRNGTSESNEENEPVTIADIEEELDIEFRHWTDLIRLIEGDEAADQVLEQIEEKGDIDELRENGGDDDD